MFAEPHLIEHRFRPSAEGDQSGQLKIFFRHHVPELAFVGRHLEIQQPFVIEQIQLLKFWFVPTQQVLRIENANRRRRIGQIDDSGPAGAGKMRQPFAESVHGVVQALANETMAQQIGSPSATAKQWRLGTMLAISAMSMTKYICRNDNSCQHCCHRVPIVVCLLVCNNGQKCRQQRQARNLLLKLEH